MFSEASTINTNALLRRKACILVAEIGNNHQGDPLIAKQCIKAVAESGADMVKMQKRHMPTLFTQAAMDRPYSGPNSFGETYGAHRTNLELSVDVMAELKAYAESLGLVWFASVWDEYSLDEMMGIGVDCIKLPSADITNQNLITKASATGLPLILSTGMSCLQQIDRAVEATGHNRSNLILLHCNSTYPSPLHEIALPAMATLRTRYGLPVGYSGHEEGIAPSLAAVALGACMVERHFTLDRRLPGTDHACSLTPESFELMARMIREVEAAMLLTEKKPTPSERIAGAKLRKKCVASRDLSSGHHLTREDIVLRCTGETGGELYPDLLIGTVLQHSIPAYATLKVSPVARTEENSIIGEPC